MALSVDRLSNRLTPDWLWANGEQYMANTPSPGCLAGKTIVVLGGTSGIGLSASKAFVAAGARVVAIGAADHSVEAARKAVSGPALFLCGDARDPRLAETAVARAVDEFGNLDGLYHIAGGSGRQWGDGPLHEVTDEGWQATLDLNLTSLFYSNRAAVRQFLTQKTGGSVLNISSVLAFSPSPQHFSTHAYTAAKSAVIGLTKACAARYAPQQIRFNVLAPGLIATPMSERTQGSAEIQQFIRAKQPLDGGRLGVPADLDGAAVFFMSDQSRFITGQVLAVDGGWSVTEALCDPQSTVYSPRSEVQSRKRQRK